MKKIIILGIFAIAIFTTIQYASVSQVPENYSLDSAEIDTDTLSNQQDSIKFDDNDFEEEEYGITDLMNTIVKPLMKKYTHRIDRHESRAIYYEKPFISLFAGQLEMMNESIKYDFEKSADIQLLLGYSSRRQYPNTSLIRTKSQFLSIKNLSNNWIDLKDESQPISARIWNIGMNRGRDYGWNFDKNFKINLTHNEGINWSFMNFNITGLDPNDTLNYPSKLNAINDKAKFGEGFSGGIEFEIFDHIVLTGGYERMDVFPAHIFWEWVVSGMIEGIGQGIVDGFINRIRKFSPLATPIINFALKNGLSYGLYELRRKNMNWPFDSAPPYVFETFKIGISYKF